MVHWLVCLGDYVPAQSTRPPPPTSGLAELESTYHDASCRLVEVLGGIGSGGPFVRYIQFKAHCDRHAIEWNVIPESKRGDDETKARFEPFLRSLREYVDAGNPTLVSEHLNALAIASRFNMVDAFGLLKERLEKAWRRHNGINSKPNYAKGVFVVDGDFVPFLQWLRSEST